jgi:hypothetical protein
MSGEEVAESHRRIGAFVARPEPPEA